MDRPTLSRTTAARSRARCTPRTVRRTVKRPFNVDEMIRRLRVAVKPYTPAAMFQLASEGLRFGLRDPHRVRHLDLPRKYWVEINKLLVPFGKFVCITSKPKCSTCPLLEFCRQVGVTTRR